MLSQSFGGRCYRAIDCCSGRISTHTHTHTPFPQPLLCCFFGTLIRMHVIVVLLSLEACQACGNVWAATTCLWYLWIIYDPGSFLRVKCSMVLSSVNLSNLGLQTKPYRSDVIRQEDELLVRRHLEFSSGQVLKKKKEKHIISNFHLLSSG